MILRNFIVLEGIDGAGTSTQLNFLKKMLPQDKTLFTAEPTDSVTGKFLRSILRGDMELDPGTTAFLFAADRHEHLHCPGGIIETCNNGGITVTDRYLFSSLAYQSASCGEALPRLLNSTFPLPEYLFFFDIEPSLSLKRISGRGVTEIYEKQDFLEKTAAEYRKVIKEYQETAKETGMNIIILDASKPVAEVSEKIWSILKNMPILKA
ncbi:MAG: dTMP kinase [Spirochaetaceae bacterium]|nr:dTMP kinase [Spirochaetaceae bacterium]